MRRPSPGTYYAVAGLFLFTLLIAAAPNQARLLPTEKALALFLGEHALTPKPPLPGPPKLYPMTPGLSPVTSNNLCFPPGTTVTEPPPQPVLGTGRTVGFGTTVTVAGQRVPVETSATITGTTTTPPTWPESSTTVTVRPPIPEGTGCPTTWGNWTTPGPFKSLKTAPVTEKYPEAVLNLWLTATENVTLISFTAKLCKGVCPGGTNMFSWNYDVQGDVVQSQPEIAAYVTLHSSPATGLPGLLIRKGESVPFTLTTTLAAEKEFLAGDKLTFGIERVQTASTNASGTPVGTLMVQYGSADTPSAVSFFLKPDSAYSNTGVLGLFLDADNALSYKFPKGTKIGQLPVPWSLGTLPDPPGPLLPPPPILVGAATADLGYVAKGNAVVKIYYVINSVNDPANKSPMSALPEVRFEVNLTIGSKVIQSNSDSLRVGVEAPRLATDTRVQKNAPRLMTFGLPTAGVYIPAGAPITLSVVAQGLTHEAVDEFVILYGTKDLPTGFKIPVAPDIPEEEGASVSGSAARYPTPTTESGAGASNGDFTVYVDHVAARVAPGLNESFLFTLQSKDWKAKPFNLSAAYPKIHKAQFAPVKGTIPANGTVGVFLNISLEPTTKPGPVLLYVNATFNTTQVGPILLTLVSDLPAEASARSVFTARTVTETTARAISEVVGIPKALSGAKQPGFELFVLSLALLVALVLARPRRG